MDLTQLANLGEFIGGVAVVITLLYLAVQVRHSRSATEANTRSLRSTARFEVARYWSEEAIRLSLSPDIATIVAAGFEDASRLEDNDRERLVAWFLQHTLMKDTLFHQFEEGVLPEDVWRAQEQVTVGLLRCEAYCRIWDAGAFPVTDGFRAYVERLRADLPQQQWFYTNKARLLD